MNLKLFTEKYNVMRNIKRFSMEFVVSPQCLSSHGYGVASIFFLICEQLRIEISAGELFIVMNHDFTETFTGDINRKVKEVSEKSAKAWRTIEDEVVPSVLKPYTDEGISKSFSSVKRNIIELADCLDAYLYCKDEVSSGNKNLSRAMSLYRKKCWMIIHELSTELASRDIEYFLSLMNIILGE